MLRERLKPYLRGLDKNEEQQAIRAVAHLLLVGDYMAYRGLIKDLNDDAQQVFYKEVRDFIRSSFECRKIWRVLFASLRGEGSIKELAGKFSADLRDVAWVWGHLTEGDKKHIRRLALRHTEGYAILTDEEFQSLVSVLDKYCAKTAYLKLRFLKDNDRVFDLEDLKLELLSHAIQVIRLYEHCGDLKKIENYAKRGVSNHAVNMIQFHTSESRARVTNNTRGCGTCIFCLTDKPQRCKSAVADYRSTTLSLQGLAPDTDSLPQPSLRLLPSADKAVQSNSFVRFMKNGLPPSALKIIDLVVYSDPDEEFEQWLAALHHTTVDKLLNNPRRLVRLLCEYLDISHTEVTGLIKDRYQEYRKSL